MNHSIFLAVAKIIYSFILHFILTSQMLDLHRQSGGWDLAALLFISLFHDENYTDVSSVTLEKN